jgi:hypothetical protein
MWTYKGEIVEDIGNYIGFVYMITNLRTERKYIGKKNFYFSKTKQLKGKKKKERCRISKQSISFNTMFLNQINTIIVGSLVRSTKNT